MTARKTPEDFYDTIATFGLRTDTVDQMRDWNARRLTRFLEACKENLPEPAVVPRSAFNFVATGHLSGLPIPCQGLNCRLGAIDELNRFAALYADSILVRERISDIVMPHGTHKTGAHRRRKAVASESMLDRMREGLANDVRVFLEIKPLMIARIASFAHSQQHWCPLCVRLAAEEGELDEFVSAASVKWQSKVATMVATLEADLLANVTGKMSFSRHLGIGIELSGPERLIEHGTLTYRPSDSTPEKFLRRARRGSFTLTANEMQELCVFSPKIDDVISDLSTQDHYAGQVGYNYITSRQLDFDLLNLSSANRPRLSPAAISAVSHPVAYLDNVPVEVLLQVRNAEGDSFKVYRDALTTLLGTVDLQNARQTREAMDDLVRPELHKIDKVLKDSRRATAKSLAQDVMIYSGLLSVGLFSGLLPPSLQGVATIVGGLAGAKSIAGKIVNVFDQPKEVRDDKFYFLWKARKAGARGAAQQNVAAAGAPRRR